MTLAESAVASPSGHLLLPENPPRFGPISRRLLARLAVGLLAVEATGTALIFSGGRAAVAAGTSLVFPGVGFLYVTWIPFFLLTGALLLLALVLWWGASAHLAIPLVWLGSSLGAAALSDGPRLFLARGTTWNWAVLIAYFLLFGSLGLAAFRIERAYRSKRASITELNNYLATATPPRVERVGRPPDDMDVELLRWGYSVANQPDDGLVGLDWGEQFHSGTQLRYQLNALSWGLSLFAANYVPNAQTQATHALEKLIMKHTDLRVWRYWRTLNILGNFDSNPDPIKRDNIMFSAFLGDVINIFEAATGSDRFDQPASLTFVWKDGRTFAYDHHSIAAAVEQNYQRSRLGFYPCEPGWSFTVCNVMGAQSLYGHDRLHGTTAWDRVKPRWVKALDNEYFTPDGSYAHIKSSLVGVAWDTGETPGGHYLATGSHRFADILPDHASRALALERRKGGAKISTLAKMVKGGRLDLELPVALERHRASSSALGAWSSLIGGARMFGEQALADAALDASARQCATGQRWPQRPLAGSAPGLGSHMIVRWGAPLGAADLNIRGYVPPKGPVISDAPWDDLLFTEARSHDGVSLTIGVEPFGTVPVEAGKLRFTKLAPGAAYALRRATDQQVLADHDGVATVSVTVTKPTRLTLVPL